MSAGEAAGGDLAIPLDVLREQLGSDIESAPRRVARGVIHSCYRLETAQGPRLLKQGAAEHFSMLEAEAEGLAELARANAIAVPRCLACFATPAVGCLVVEWIEFAPTTAASAAALGRGLAVQHRYLQPRYGWRRDNWLGPTPQHNAPRASWCEFWRDCRLVPQLELARQRGLPAALQAAGRRVIALLPRLLDGHTPPASLLHGDLWSGNWGADRAGRPYLYDPAPYYGDRETDLAMSRLFGGFDAEFYRAYEEFWPLPPGACLRAELYNLYHLLNHYNIFGASYLEALGTTLDLLTAESRPR